MKKYFYMAIFAFFVTACTNENIEELTVKNKKNNATNFSITQRDSIATFETGGQTGTTPVKPPKPPRP